MTLARALQVTVVLVTHELPSIHRVADDCIMLDRDARGVIARGSPRDLSERSEDPRVRAFFEAHGLVYDVRPYFSCLRQTLANLHAVGHSTKDD